MGRTATPELNGARSGTVVPDRDILLDESLAISIELGHGALDGASVVSAGDSQSIATLSPHCLQKLDRWLRERERERESRIAGSHRMVTDCML